MTDEERELYLPAIKAFIKVLESDNLTQEEVDELVTEGEKLQVNFIKNPLFNFFLKFPAKRKVHFVICSENVKAKGLAV